MIFIRAYYFYRKLTGLVAATSLEAFGNPTPYRALTFQQSPAENFYIVHLALINSSSESPQHEKARRRGMRENRKSGLDGNFTSFVCPLTKKTPQTYTARMQFFKKKKLLSKINKNK